MIGLFCCEETMTICLPVATEYWNVTDGRTDRHNCYINIAHQCADMR